MKKAISVILVMIVVLTETSCVKQKQTFTCTCNWTNILAMPCTSTYQIKANTREDANNDCNMSHVNTIWPGQCGLQ